MDWKVWTILISVIVGVIALLIILPLYLQAYNQLNQCRMEPNFYCFWDYVFLKVGTSTYTCPTQAFYGCGPGIERAEGYCDNPANADKPGCNCKLQPDGSVPTTCGCAYYNAGALGTQDNNNFNALCNGNVIPVNPKPPSSK